MIKAYLKKIYLLPWSLWCLVSFGIICFFIYITIIILTAIPSRKTYVWAHRIPTFGGILTAFLWGVRVDIDKKWNWDISKQYIFVGNHRSMLDAIISGAFIPNDKKFIGKAEILKWPFLGYLLGKLYIPVKRDEKDSRRWSMEQLFIKMKEGLSIVIFSEGTCNTTSSPLMPFKEGAYRLSCATKIPIIPFVIVGADDLWSRNVWLIAPGKVKLIFLPEIAPEADTEEGIELQKNKVYSAIETEYLKNIYK
jgi:1-acyl-sn-glycerol-3-phosphate acyltransferase